MALLIVQLPSQPRLAAQQADMAAAADTELELEFVLYTAHAGEVRRGRCAPSALPPAQELVALIAPNAVSWHRLTLPKASGPRLRQALAGLLEDTLLEEDADLHLAVAPESAAGTQAWVAALHKSWLKGWIDTLEAAGRPVDRVAPLWPADGAPAAHVFSADHGLSLAWRDSRGVAVLPVNSPMVKVLMSSLPEGEHPRWSACPEGAERAALLAGAPVASVPLADTWHEAAASAWNLRQFDLAPERRSERAIKELLQTFWRSPAWRPARVGLATLIVLQLVATNVWAWQQRRALDQQRLSMNSLLQATFPNVRAIVDASAQMRKELDLLRAAAGKPGDTDVETLLAAAESAWPQGRGPASAIAYEPGRLNLTSPGWSANEMAAFRAHLLRVGLDADPSPNGPAIIRARPGTAAPVVLQGHADPSTERPAGPRPARVPHQVSEDGQEQSSGDRTPPTGGAPALQQVPPTPALPGVASEGGSAQAQSLMAPEGPIQNDVPSEENAQ